MTAVSKYWHILCMILVCCFTSNVAQSRANADATHSPHLWNFKLPMGVLDSNQMGKIVCSLAGSHSSSCPTETAAIRQPAYVAPTAPVADIEFDQFSLEQFGQIGFTPQCLFVDQSGPQGYLETKIARTLENSPNPIYDLSNNIDSLTAANSTPDPYWEYYSDCDAWDVVFARLPSSSKLEVVAFHNDSKNPWSEFWDDQFQSIQQQISDGWIWSYWNQAVETMKWMEFQRIEMEEVPVSVPVHDIIIEQLKTIQPVMKRILDNQLVNNPQIWVENRFCQVEGLLGESGIREVWQDLSRVQYLGNVSVHEDLRTSESNDWTQRISWLTDKIEKVVNQISTR